jgi:hypothetical protein
MIGLFVNVFSNDGLKPHRSCAKKPLRSAIYNPDRWVTGLTFKDVVRFNSY